jgi:hypothetical protein
MNKYLNKYLLDDESDSDLLTIDLLEVDKSEKNTLVLNEHLNKKEIIIEINIDVPIDEDDLDFIDDDFEYIDEESSESE